MNSRIFGTDGIRALVGSEKMHPKFIMHLGWALGKTLPPRSSVLVGKDTRISGYMFESALESGLSAAGADVFLLGPLPTPGIAYLTKTLRAKAGIVISASHNPYHDNGIKLFSSLGQKLSKEQEMEIEKWLDKPMELVDSAKLGKVKRINDAVSRYVEFCKSTVNHLNLSGLHIVVDCANGAAYKTAPLVFGELGARVTLIGDEPNGLNINTGIGSTHPEVLAEKVKELNASFGLALDGDADRCILCDEDGQLVDGDEILYLIVCDRLAHNKLDNKIAVGTLMTNLGVEQALNKLGVKLIRSDVGDKYVLADLLKHNAIIGGESSGHILCLDTTTTGDGIVSALQVLRFLMNQTTTLKRALKPVQKLPLRLINVPVADSSDVMQSDSLQRTKDKFLTQLGDHGRILLRESGTEPLIRVMVEGRDINQVNEIANKLADVIRRFK